MRSSLVVLSLALTTGINQATSFSMSIKTEGFSRRAFVSSVSASTAAFAAIVTSGSSPAAATPQIYNTPEGVKYAILKEPKDPKKAIAPMQNDIVAIDYTGYLADGTIFDATHAEGKGKELLFQLGSPAVIKGLNVVVSNMVVGQKVQAIIPPSLAFGDKGVCIEDGECLVKPGATLVYDVYLKKSSIPPP
jgi:FKBP-type peptidyl-prolyl cis-trans isomerase